MKAILADSHSLMALFVIICATILVILGKLTPNAWVSLAQWVFTAFIGGHAAMQIASSMKSGNGSNTSNDTTNPK